MNQFQIAMTVIYFVLVFAAITAEHFTFGVWWKYNEMARRALGISTVMGLAAPFLFFLGAWDTAQEMFLIIAGGFLTAAATKMFFVQLKKENERQKLIELEKMVNADSDHF